jgi:hypothetical protein
MAANQGGGKPGVICAAEVAAKRMLRTCGKVFSDMVTQYEDEFVAPPKLFGAGLVGTAGKAADARRWLSDQHGDDHADHGHGANVSRHDEHISTFCLTIDEPVDWRSFSRWLGRLKIKRADNLLRVKGLLQVAGERGPIAIHGVHHVFSSAGCARALAVRGSSLAHRVHHPRSRSQRGGGELARFPNDRERVSSVDGVTPKPPVGTDRR